ncbi:hypothetical protein TI39_contig4221g00003 [Zymoseptoria brevis]|uniref:Proteasome assembly chaperone 3 n=1 Tax=Zymoseptoria brevis TaxID=1047168 RepID=A0A0F4G9P8_9PEZI|nr:hypothetical protein TI39_contig4221g00003 [Zymoseptoria brevis]
MATSTLPAPTAFPSPFPVPSKSTCGHINGVLTEVSSMVFSDKILITISQAGKLAHWVHVPLATATADPLSGPISNSSSENELLPMSHLTATTVLGGTRRDDEIIGQTLATTIASALLVKRPQEERLLVIGAGWVNAAETLTGRAQFEEVLGLVLEVL